VALAASSSSALPDYKSKLGSAHPCACPRRRRVHYFLPFVKHHQLSSAERRHSCCPMFADHRPSAPMRPVHKPLSCGKDIPSECRSSPVHRGSRLSCLVVHKVAPEKCVDIRPCCPLRMPCQTSGRPSALAHKPIPGRKEVSFPRSTCVRRSRARCSLIGKSDRVPVFFFLLERAYSALLGLPFFFKNQPKQAPHRHGPHPQAHPYSLGRVARARSAARSSTALHAHLRWSMT
jgi:hypothetical protein